MSFLVHFCLIALFFAACGVDSTGIGKDQDKVQTVNGITANGIVCKDSLDCIAICRDIFKQCQAHAIDDVHIESACDRVKRICLEKLEQEVKELVTPKTTGSGDGSQPQDPDR